MDESSKFVYLIKKGEKKTGSFINKLKIQTTKPNAFIYEIESDKSSGYHDSVVFKEKPVHIRFVIFGILF